MPFDANGNYTLPTIYIAIPGEVIKSTQHNTPFEDVQAALNNTLCRDGRTPWTGNQNANNNKLTGLAKGTNSTDAVRMDQAATLDGVTDFTGKVTVQDVDDWTSNEAVPASGAEGRYVGKAEGATDYAPLQAGVNKSSGNLWLSYLDGSGSVKWAFAQQPGDYATNTALSSETTRATTAENNLQSSKVNRAGDTMTGSLSIKGTYGAPTGYSWSEALAVVNTASGSSAQFICATQYGSDTAIRLKSFWGSSNSTNFDFHQNGRISSDAGNVAFQSDLPSLPGNTLQVWHVDNVASMSTITFPRAFSSAPLAIWCQDMDGENVGNATIRNRSNTGFQVQTGNNNTRNITFFALGYV